MKTKVSAFTMLTLLVIGPFPEVRSRIISVGRKCAATRDLRQGQIISKRSTNFHVPTPTNEYQSHYTNPNYSYAYGVVDDKTGDMKKVFETRQGDFVHGGYQVLQPDGILRVVTYTSDPVNGFQSKVQMLNGYAIHPIPPLITI